MKYPREAGRCF